MAGEVCPVQRTLRTRNHAGLLPQVRRAKTYIRTANSCRTGPCHRGDRSALNDRPFPKRQI
eukprot:9224426-Pyramimonas_sp.AAC.1